MGIGWMKGRLWEAAKFVLVTPPIDSTGAAVSSLWVSMANHRRCLFVLQYGAKTTTDAQTAQVNQATSNAGAGSKIVAIDDAYKSVGQTQVSGGDALVAVTPSSNTVAIVNTDDNGVFLIDIRDDMLDINNGFKFVQVAVTSPGAHADLTSILAILYDADNGGKPTTLPTVLA